MLFTLPAELQENIFLFLHYLDLYSLYLCGKRKEILSPSLWRSKAQRDLGVSPRHFNLTKKAAHVRYYELYRMFHPKQRRVPKLFLQGLEKRKNKELLSFYYFLSGRKEEFSKMLPEESQLTILDYSCGKILRYYFILSSLGRSNQELDKFISGCKERLRYFPSLYSYYHSFPLNKGVKASLLSQLLYLEKRVDLYYTFFSFLDKNELIIFLSNLITTRDIPLIEEYISFLEKKDMLSQLYEEEVVYEGRKEKGVKLLSDASSFSNSPYLIKRFASSVNKDFLILGFLYSPNLDFFYLAREYGLKKEDLKNIFHPDAEYL